MQVDERPIRVIVFSGKQQDWSVWEAKFLARAKKKGYKNLLVGSDVAPPDGEIIDETNEEGKEKKRLREANEAAYEDLILSIDGTSAYGRVAFNLVRLAKTRVLADGDAKLAWARLQNKYATKSAPSLLALKKEFTNSRLASKRDDPDLWITNLEDIRMKIESQGSKIDDVDFMIHILNNLPREYEVSQAKLEDRLNDDIDPLTIEEIRTELNLKFSRLNPKKNAGIEEDESDETALFNGTFKGFCHNCGERGHKKPNCPKAGGVKKNSQSGPRRNFNGKTKMKCAHCGKGGHTEDKCWSKWGKPERANFGSEPAELVLHAFDVNDDARANDQANSETPKASDHKNKGDNEIDEISISQFNFGAQDVGFSDNTWIGDSGASCHMTNSDEGMFDWKRIDEEITIGNGKPMKATKVGSLRLESIQKDGSMRSFKMTNVKYIPELYCKLFSVTTALDKGFHLGNKGRMIYLQKGDFRLEFDKIFETKTGFILGVDLVTQISETAQAGLEAGREININDLHERLGHPSEEATRKTGKMLGLKVTGAFQKCENCAISKARRMNLNKERVERSKTRGFRLFIDVSSIKTVSFGGKKFWLLILDDCTDCCFSFFLKSKDEVSTKVREFIQEIKVTQGIEVKTIRCDNSGENRQLERDSKRDGLGIKFEYTAVNTPQQNGRVERKFAALYGRVRSMLNSARVTKQLRSKLWAECAQTATACENLLISDNEQQCRYQLFYRENPKYARHLHKFGEIGILTNHVKITSKLSDRGKPALFLGYLENHAGNTFKFLNLETNKVVLSRDVIWLNKNFAEWKGLKGIHTTKIDQNDDYEDDEFDNQPIETLSNEIITDNLRERATSSTRLTRELRGLQFRTDGGNPTADEELEKLENARTGREDDAQANTMFAHSHFSFFAKETMLNAITKKEPPQLLEEPKTFKDAWDNPNEEQRTKWQDAIKKELQDMEKRQVWELIKRTDMPNDRRCVKCKWVFKIKRNGIFRARLVACGYSQIPGIDFTENYAPVINDATWRIMLTTMILWNLKGVLLDVECAFLEGELEEEVYMNCPEGLKGVDNQVDCLRLKKSIYGLVQSARQWWKKFVKVLRQIGFQGGYADPCLFTKRDQNGIIFIALYVDDCLCIGHEVAIDLMVDELRKFNLKMKVDKELKDYLSCEIHFSPDRKSIVLHQGHIITSLRNEFETEVQNLQEYRTPGTPGQGMSRGNGKVTVSPAEQSRFRMGIGKLLYLVKHTRPDIANAVRELSKMLDCTTPNALKEMRRVIKYVLDTESYGLKISPVMPKDKNLFELQVYCDSDFAGDKDTRISVAGFIVYLCGVPISWRSKAMRHVTLSSSEAEYVSLSEAAKEIKFIAQVIESMGIEIKRPIEVRVDNLGAIFMANNISISPRTKHVDVRYRFITELIEDGLIEVKFVKTEENDSDGFTKNLNGDLYEKHKAKYIIDKEEIKDDNKIFDDDGPVDRFANRKGVGE